MNLTRLISKFSKMMAVNSYADIFCSQQSGASDQSMSDLQIQNKLVDGDAAIENESESGPKKNVYWLTPRLRLRGLTQHACFSPLLKTLPSLKLTVSSRLSQST